MKKYIFILFFISTIHTECEPGFIEINELCFYENDINILQKMIDNSYQSNIDLGCQDGDNYCGSPNPYMDDPSSWFWKIIDGQEHYFSNDNGIVEPLEIGIQEWENGRLKTLMCGAYIYCQLSGPIPQEIVQLTEIETFRLEYNYLSGFIPEGICELNAEHNDYLAFDVSGNRLCPPYPECINTSYFWSQDTSFCYDIGDVNLDYFINILDIVLLITYILEFNYLDYQDFIISDINADNNLDVIDVVILVDLIIN